MKLILITLPDNIPAEGNLLNSLFDTGLELLHLRKPDYTVEQMIELLESISPEYYKRIALHDHHLLGISYGMKRIHLNNRNLLPPEVEGLKLSRSCHSFQEIEEISGYEYVFLSPIFDSISKKNYKSSFLPKELEEYSKKKLINNRIIALGGIDKTNISLVRQYGFGGVAVMGSIWGEYSRSHDITSVITRFQELQKICAYE
ncbi:MAG: thiamine phosphate synthase [Tannerellaceae bacterium]|nr:thiamine phosphate synthase [Tannerellaceae bacterium]